MNRMIVRLLAALLVALLAGLGAWSTRTPQAEQAPAPAPQDRTTTESRAPAAKPPSRPAADARRSPLDAPEVADEVARTLALIERGGPFPHRQDGAVFQNREGRLPPGDYREYTVRTPGAPDRGARRIVVDQRSGRRYYTGDHYRTFVLLDPPQEGGGHGGRR